MEDILEKAKADQIVLERRRDALANEMQAVEAKLVKLAAFIELYGKYCGLDPSGESANDFTAGPNAAGNGAEGRRRLRPGSTVAGMARTASDAILAAGRPLSINELLKAVTAAGFEIGGERPATNLSSVLSRSDIVNYERGVGWNVARQRD